MTQKYTITFTETTRVGDKRPSWEIVGADRVEAQQNAFNAIRDNNDWDLPAKKRCEMQSFEDAVEHIRQTAGGGLDVAHSPDDGMSPTEVDILAKTPINQAYIKKDLTDHRDDLAKSTELFKELHEENLKDLKKAQQTLDDYFKEQGISEEQPQNQAE